MAGRFQNSSKYRNIYGKSTRKEFCYDNLRISKNAWDTNLIKANPEFLAVNWESSGGGAFAVIPLNEKGKLPDLIPLFRGHTAAVLDTDWNPFNDRQIASASDDGKIMLWEVPNDFTLFTDDEDKLVRPKSTLSGHSRKVGQVLFNPAAENILASASADLTIKLWDIGAESVACSLQHPDVIQSLSWSADGSRLVTTSRDKTIRIWDPRQSQTKAALEWQGHSGGKNCRVVWLGSQDKVATTGFSRMSDRQLALWELKMPNPKPVGDFQKLDTASGVLMPFWDDESNMIYLAGKGDGNIRYMEYRNGSFDELPLSYKSTDPQRGLALIPKRGVNVHENEVARAFKTVNDTYIEPISFIVPRRAEGFQSDIFPPFSGLEPGVRAQEWLDGKTALPEKFSFEAVYEGKAPVKVDYKPPVSAPAPAPVQKAVAPKQPEPAPAPAATRAPPSMKDQQGSMAAMVSKYEDDEDDEEDDISSFEEVSRPVQRNAAPATRVATSAVKATPASPKKASSPVKSPTQPSAPASNSRNVSSGSGVESTLEEMKKLLENQSELLNTLIAEVDSLKKRVGSGSQDQNERIRQLELELEEARS
ncbi:DUF1900-domain-containing protein [Xylariaceae sp. FL0255]|nr:DUF1900-domain-containing protein [Xylariaceae sp. FL0255]